MALTTRTFAYGGHCFTIDHNLLGSTDVFCDGQKVASGGGLGAIHAFWKQEENGSVVTYEIEERMGLFDSHYTVRREGVIIFQS